MILTDKINETTLTREFVIMETSMNTSQGQVFKKERKTQVKVNGLLLVTLSGHNTDKVNDLLTVLYRINAYNKLTGKFKI